MKKRLLLYLLIFQNSYSVTSSLSAVLQQYEQALIDLLKVPVVGGTSTTNQLNQTSMAFITYKKIVAPYIAYINGYGLVVQSEFAHGLSYYQDLKTLSAQFALYKQDAIRLSTYFPVNQQKQVINWFYQQFEQTVVQICFNIVQKISYALTVNPESLASCYLAYQLANEMYVSGMQIQGVPVNSDMQSTLAQDMVSLYQAAINQKETALSSGLTQGSSVQDLYTEISSYYTILATVYKNQGNSTLSTHMQNQAAATKQQFAAYQNAQNLYTTTNTQAKVARITIPLDVLNTAAVETQLKSNQAVLVQVYQSYQKVITDYQQANDLIGQQQCNQAIQLVTNVDLVIRALGLLWVLYMTDQSAHSVYTAPTIQSLIKKSSDNPVSTENVQAAFQNLADFITQSSNDVSLLGAEQISQYSITNIVNLLSTNSLNIAQSMISQDVLINFSTFKNIELVIQYLSLFAQSVVTAFKQSQSSAVAMAMTYAQAMDTIYPASKKTDYQAYVPYFPDQLEANATWQNWTAAILVATDLVATTQDALSQVGKATIQKPITTAQSNANITVQTTQAETLTRQGQTLTQSGNFLDATQKYEAAYNAYHQLYTQQAQTTQGASIYQKAMLLRTLLSASSFASTIIDQGDATWSTISHIPSQYVAREYQFQQIAISALGGTVLPTSLLSLTPNSTISTISTQQEQDIFTVLRAYLVSQFLQQQGVNFTDCFSDYSLTLRPNLSKTEASCAKKALAQTQASVNNFQNCTVLSIVLQDDSVILSVNCGNVLIPPVRPLYASMATAVTFLQSAYLLFGAGTQNINLGGVSYVPGNDSVAANQVLQAMVYAYISDAYKHYQLALQLMNKIEQEITDSTLPAIFSDAYASINKSMTRAQALLYAPDQSAYVYASKMSSPDLAQDIKNMFLGIYQDLVTWMQKCLIGDPSSSNYQMLLHQINETYINWASMLDPVADAATIKGFNMSIAQLFENAGNACMQSSYTNPLYPNMPQKHYGTAAQYFLAAKSKYQTLQQTALVSKVSALINTAYFHAGSQNIESYLYVKEHGITYVSSVTKGSKTVSFTQLLQDDANGIVDGGEQSAYDAVKNLLLNAGMAYKLLAGIYAPTKSTTTKSKAPASTTTSSSSSTTTTPTTPTTTKSSAVISFLRTQKVIGPNITEIPYNQSGIVEAIFNVNNSAYQKFQTKPKSLGDWMNVLLLATGNLYAQDYLGATTIQTGSQATQQMLAFFQAMQSEAASLQNPSSVYVG